MSYSALITNTSHSTMPPKRSSVFCTLRIIIRIFMIIYNVLHHDYEKGAVMRAGAPCCRHCWLKSMEVKRDF